MLTFSSILILVFEPSMKYFFVNGDLRTTAAIATTSRPGHSARGVIHKQASFLSLRFGLVCGHMYCGVPGSLTWRSSCITAPRNRTLGNNFWKNPLWEENLKHSLDFGSFVVDNSRG